MFERRSAEDFEKWISRCGNMPQRFGERMGLDPEVVRDVVKRVRHRHSDTWELMKSISIHLHGIEKYLINSKIYHILKFGQFVLHAS